MDVEFLYKVKIIGLNQALEELLKGLNFKNIFSSNKNEN